MAVRLIQSFVPESYILFYLQAGCKKQCFIPPCKIHNQGAFSILLF